MVSDLESTPTKSGLLAQTLQKLSIPQHVIRLSAETAGYGVGKLGEGLAALVLIPVLTRAFTPDEFGVWDLTMTLFFLMAMAGSLGLEQSLAAFYFETEEPQRKKLVASTSIQFRLIFSVVVGAAVFALAPQLSQVIFGEGGQAPYFRIVAVAIPFFLAVNIFKLLLRLDFAPGKFNIVAAGYAAVYAALAILLVSKMRMGVSGALYAVAASAACFSVVGGVFTVRHFSFRFSGRLLKDMLRFSLPLLPSIFACWVIDFSDRYFLARMSTLEQLGIYSVGARISSIVILFSTSFQMAWAPYALSIQHEDDVKEKYSQGLSFFLCAGLAGAAAITIFAGPLLVLLTQPTYYGAQRVIGLLALGPVAYGAFLVLNIGLMIEKKTMLTSVAITAGAVLNIVLNVLLIPRFGMTGAAVATLVSYLTALALLYHFSQKYYPVDYKLGRTAGPALLSIGAMAISTAVEFDSAPVDLLFRTLLLAGLVYILLRVFLLRPDES